jgi:hypothetical protein
MANSLTEPFVRTEFTLRATINGVVFDDVVAISATFGMNMIPTATLTLAAGREVRTGEPATIHKYMDKLTPRAEAEVTLTIKSTQGHRDAPIINGMRDGTYVIFRGYYAGVGYQRAHNNAAYTIHLIHWLDDLNCSSMLNGNWAPGAPHDLAQCASWHALNQMTGGSGVYTAVAPMIDDTAEKNPIVSKENMEDDLWGKVIKEIFTRVARFQHPNTQCDDDQILEEEKAKDENGNNGAALKAFERMPGVAPIPGTLGLDLEGVDEVLATVSAHDGLTRLITEGMGYNTFWGKLVGEIGPSFLFAISPGVEFANVVPFFPGLQTPYTTIHGEEYNYANFNSNVAHLLESVNIFYSPPSSSGLYMGGSTPSAINYCDPWGKYPEKNTNFRGNILVREPPIWLANSAYASLWVKGTTLAPPAGSTAAPQAGDSASQEGPLRAPDTEQNIKGSNVLNRFAEHWYKSAILGQRYGELSGKFRLDIAPGSVVKIVPPDSAIEQEKMTMYASVTQVSYIINSEQHVAGTSFTLANIRSQTENQNTDEFTKTHPPLYKPSVAWYGGPLVVGQTAPGVPTPPAAPTPNEPEFLAPETFMI